MFALALLAATPVLAVVPILADESDFPVGAVRANSMLVVAQEPPQRQSATHLRKDWIRAIGANRVDVLDALLPAFQAAGQDPNVRARDGKTALMAAASRGADDLVARLLGAGANASMVNAKGSSALLYAAWDGNADVVDRLLATNAPINQAAINGWTAVMMAAAKGHTRALARLLSAGAMADARDVQGWTPLMRASDLGREDSVTLLLARGRVDAGLVNPAGQTALHIASGAGHMAIVTRLVAAGVDQSLKDFRGRTAADLAQALSTD